MNLRYLWAAKNAEPLLTIRQMELSYINPAAKGTLPCWGNDPSGTVRCRFPFPSLRNPSSTGSAVVKVERRVGQGSSGAEADGARGTRETPREGRATNHQDEI